MVFRLAYSEQNNFPKRELIRAGNHKAGCFAVIDIGTQLTTFKGEPKEVRKLRLGFEILDQADEDGKPRLSWPKLTASLGQKAHLRKHVESWLSRTLTAEEAKEGFDMDSLIGRAAILNFIHKSSNTGTDKWPELVAIIAGEHSYMPTRKTISFDLSNYDPVVYQQLPKFIKEEIAESKEFLARLDGKRITPDIQQPQNRVVRPEPDLDDEIPF